jgi:hypothetical protein
MADNARDLLIDELVRNGNGLLGVRLVVSGEQYDLLSQHPALLVPFGNGQLRCVLEVHAHLALVAGHGARCADPDHVVVLADAAGCG